ncbi:MAG TPA: hypothetical protein VFL27_06795 [Candidatus Dormibacteraeota bacterium]|nr:hypothetical protein [Candidatus Dormibacteraeota bacterium]
MVVTDYTHNQVRLALENATDIAAVTGQFDGIVGGEAIVSNGVSLLAVSRTGAVTRLGLLAGQPQWSGAGTVAVNPSLTQWIYTLTSFSDLTSQIHLGTRTSDSVIATVPSPDGYDFYQAFTWNTSGAYLVKQGTGLGGVGPFLEYHFPLAKINLSTGQVTVVSPTCVAEAVLDDGTLLCRTTTGGVEVRSPSGATHSIQLARGTSGADGIYSKLTLTSDQKHFAAARNGSADPSLVNYEIVAAELTSTTVGVFGPVDFLPDAWLPDGRLVADHYCWTFQQNGGPCDQSLDGTYFLSADGHSLTLFYKLAQGSSVVAAF